MTNILNSKTTTPTKPEHFRVTLRQYTKSVRGHSHDYHQLVLPLSGSISVTLSGNALHTHTGECLVIKSNTYHEFSADEHSVFVVVDLDVLPLNLSTLEQNKVYLENSFVRFLQFIAEALSTGTTNQILDQLTGLFWGLVQQQTRAASSDKKIDPVLARLHHDLSQTWTIEKMAEIACLSPTQFKTRFKQHVGQSALNYLTTLRMQKAESLLRFTDTPLSLVAELVGYSDMSAFTRRFKASFGITPRQLRVKN